MAAYSKEVLSNLFYFYGEFVSTETEGDTGKL